jgi:hypothetical protein
LLHVALACAPWPLGACAVHRGPPPAIDASSSRPEQIEARLASYPLASRLHIRLVSGERVDGVLLFLDRGTITIASDHDEPAREIALVSIAEVSSYTTAGHKTQWAMVWAGVALLTYLYLSGRLGPG